MPNKVKIVLNRAGVKEMLQSQEALSMVTEKAQSYLSSLGDGYEVEPFIGHDRAQASIKAVTYEARLDNYENNTLLKVVN